MAPRRAEARPPRTREPRRRHGRPPLHVGTVDPPVTTVVGLAVAVLTLAACGGATEYPGEFTVANGDSSFYVGELFQRDTVTVKCTEKAGPSLPPSARAAPGTSSQPPSLTRAVALLAAC